MENEEGNKSSESFPMNGGDGRYSYTRNSSYQRGVGDAAKELINKAIADNLEIKHLSSSSSSPILLSIADLGCSVGPNTFIAMQNIVEAMELKYQSQNLEFQVFFNDHTCNDFNTLLRSLPPNKPYFATAVPGSFYGRLFLKGSLHFIHSSYSLHWLSMVPKQVLDNTSPAWNKGRVHYRNAPDEVIEAYSAQYTRDVESFLHARAEELVSGGLMVLVVLGRPNGVSHSQAISNMLFEFLGSCLMDMAKMGLVSEAKVDSFNLPVYTMSPQELEELIQRNGCFSLERIEPLPRSTSGSATSNIQSCTLHMRAAMEGLVKEYFGHEIVDELFDRYSKKLEESSFCFGSGKGINIFALLKRKASDAI